MNGYMGQRNPPKDHPYVNYTAKDWALYFIGSYGQIDGSHHKQWVLDQVARILMGTPVTIKLAVWKNFEEANHPDASSVYDFVDISNGEVGEYRVWLEDEDSSEEYHSWVKEMRGEYDEENEEYEYGYDVGIPP